MIEILRKYTWTNCFVFIFIVWIVLESFIHIFFIDKQNHSLPVISKYNVGLIKVDHSLISKTASMMELTSIQHFFIRFLAPHEIFFWADINPANQTKSFYLSISPKRLTPIIKWILLNNLKNQFPTYNFETFKDEHHHWVIKTTLPVHISTLVEPKIIKSNQIQMTLNNNGNLVLDNHSRKLYLSFLPTQNEDEHPLSEKQKIFDNAHLANLLYRVIDLNMQLDIIDTKIKISLLVNCPNEITTKQTEFILMTVRDIAYRGLMDLDHFLEGNLVKSYNKISGQFSIIPFSEILQAIHE